MYKHSYIFKGAPSLPTWRYTDIHSCLTTYLAPSSAQRDRKQRAYPLPFHPYQKRCILFEACWFVPPSMIGSPPPRSCAGVDAFYSFYCFCDDWGGRFTICSLGCSAFLAESCTQIFPFALLLWFFKKDKKVRAPRWEREGRKPLSCLLEYSACKLSLARWVVDSSLSCFTASVSS